MNSNPHSKDIDIFTDEGLELLKVKAKYYGHYTEQLKVFELIEEIEQLKEKYRQFYFKYEGPKVI